MAIVFTNWLRRRIRLWFRLRPPPVQLFNYTAMIGVHIDCPNYVTDLFPCLLLYNPPPPMDNNKTNLLLFTFPGKQGNDPVPSHWLPPSPTKCRRVAGSTSNQDVMSVRHHNIGIHRSVQVRSINRQIQVSCVIVNEWMNEKEREEPVEVTELFDFSTFIYYIHPPTTHAKGKLFNCHKSWEGRTEGVKHMRVYFVGTCIGIWKINSSPPAPPFDQFIRIQFRGFFILCSP